MHFGNAKAKPREMKAAATTTQPQPPSGGVYLTGPLTADIGSGSLLDPHNLEEELFIRF